MPWKSIGNFVASAVAIGCLSLAQFSIAQTPTENPAADDSLETVELSLSTGLSQVVGAEEVTLELAPLEFSDYPVEQVAAMESCLSCGTPAAGPAPCCDKKKTEAAAAKAKDAYKGVFYANDFGYLNDPCYKGKYPGDALKQIAMPHKGKLDMGGEVRVRYHSEENHRNAIPVGSGLTGLDDQFWLTRVRLFANYRVNDWMRVYGEFEYADSAGEQFAARTIEENRGDAQNLFVDAKLLDNGSSKLTGRVGRQELLYGSERLVSPLDWANTRRTFDGYKMLYSGEAWDIDGFFVNPTDRSVANVSSWDSANSLVDFYGAYATRKGLDIGTLDFYYLGIDYEVPGATFHTLGKRLAGSRDAWLYETEGGFQFGQNSDGSDHSASFFTAGLGRKMDISVGGSSWKPTVWGWYDYASGEGTFAEASRFGDGFDHLFPLGHKYLGFIDLFGRRNIHDINTQFITPVGERVNLLVWYHYLMLDEATTPYNINLNPYNTTNAASDRELGHEIDVLFNIAINPRNSALVGYSYFASGDYYTETPGVAFRGDAQFFYAQYQMRF